MSSYEQKGMSHRAAVYLEECHVSGDTMLEINHSIDELPESQLGSYLATDLMVGFATTELAFALCVDADDAELAAKDAELARLRRIEQAAEGMEKRLRYMKSLREKREKDAWQGTTNIHVSLLFDAYDAAALEAYEKAKA